ncbi:MAG: hypothetical protein AAGG09_13785 [Pseudomonadota bacterium]
MTNGIAIALGLLIAGAVAANFALGWELEVALGRRMIAAIEWLAFWR